jgi:tellurite resistance protein
VDDGKRIRNTWSMSKLVLDDTMARAYLGALLAVARVDGVVNPAESRVLRDIAEPIASAVGIEFEDILMSQVTPASVERAVSSSRTAPYRDGSRSPLPEIGAAFADAARRVAEADGEINDNETRAIHNFVQAFGG